MVEVLETHCWVANACARMDEPARMISLALSQDNTAMDIKAYLGVLIKERFLAARHIGQGFSAPPLLVGCDRRVSMVKARVAKNMSCD